MKPVFLEEMGQQVEEALRRFLPPVDSLRPWLEESMRYSTFAPGKRIRPVLLLEVNRVLGGGLERALPAACALEMVHTFSLVHDDLPGMDDDDLRRGQATCHKVYGEGMAILAGDGLLVGAFLTLIRHLEGTDRVIRCQQELGEATMRLIRGQAADIRWSGSLPSSEKLEAIHRDKTACLLRCACRMGALVAGGSNEDVEQFGRYGEALGLAFQIVDDLLDLSGDRDSLGKTAGKDEKSQKITAPAVYGVEASRNRARELVGQAKTFVAGYAESRGLKQLAEYCLERSG
ncbi:MAG: polyprenyl synthetase family protein [Planctomycetota bacterium]|nr:polyprenyl synthetase family protein [Planctomycetota bacterium]